MDLPQQNMDQSVAWNDLDHGDGVVYPYNIRIDCIPRYVDVYDRNVEWLVASLAHFGHLVHSGEALQDEGAPPSPDDVSRNLTRTRLCSDTTLPIDFQSWTNEFAHFRRNNCIVLDSQELPNSDNLDAFPNLTSVEDIIIYHHIPPNNWVVFFAVVSNAHKKTSITIETYFIGSVDLSDVNDVVLKLYRVFIFCFQLPFIRLRRRLHVPTGFTRNNAFFTFLLIYYLQ